MTKRKSNNSHGKMNSLIFIDTNIYLNFYRNSEKFYEVSMLKHITENKDKMICTEQVFMEYKKNRQNVILKALAAIKVPEWSEKIPAFLLGSKGSKQITLKKKELKKNIINLQKRMREILKNPTQKDSIYNNLQKLFREDFQFFLSRKKEIRFALRELAIKRFYLGYPPRKDRDTSIGDAINWEWIIQCAKDTNKDIIIVSSDGDYGSHFERESILNDWLKHEFKDRISKKRNIILTDKLSKAFKFIGVKITKKEEVQEEKIILLEKEESEKTSHKEQKIQADVDSGTLNFIDILARGKNLIQELQESHSKGKH